MKSTLVLLAMAAFAACALARPDQTYTNKYDNIDLTEILKNRRLLVPYVKCVLDQGKCTPSGKELKSHIAEALQTYCEKCTEFQRNGSRSVIGHLINHEPAYWNELTAKYDPNSRFVKQYEQELRTVKA